MRFLQILSFRFLSSMPSLFWNVPSSFGISPLDVVCGTGEGGILKVIFFLSPLLFFFPSLLLPLSNIFFFEAKQSSRSIASKSKKKKSDEKKNLSVFSGLVAHCSSFFAKTNLFLICILFSVLSFFIVVTPKRVLYLTSPFFLYLARNKNRRCYLALGSVRHVEMLEPDFQVETASKSATIKQAVSPNGNRKVERSTMQGISLLDARRILLLSRIRPPPPTPF